MQIVEIRNRVYNALVFYVQMICVKQYSKIYYWTWYWNRIRRLLLIYFAPSSSLRS